MKKLRNILLAFFSLAMVFIFGMEVFAAVAVNVTITGHVEYTPYEIGAEIWATNTYLESGVRDDSTYLTISGSGSFTNNVYEISGTARNFTGITADLRNIMIVNASDSQEVLLFIKNEGERYIIPIVDYSVENEEMVDITIEYYYFDLSETGHQDPLTIKGNSASATAFVSSVQSEIDDDHYSAWNTNSSIDYEDVLCIRMLISPNTSYVGDIDTDIALYLGFAADVQYTSHSVLSIYQQINITSPNWTKFGYNATLSAAATKVSDKNMTNLYTYLRDDNVSYATDDYQMIAPVYKDIDVVNVDIATGEIIGKLSDVDYPFEWFGREIELEAGTVLASGRTLETDETFTVDVYTYYPHMFVRRWVVGTEQWISVSNEYFAGAAEIPEYYVATFEATAFNPDKTVAHNSYGIIPRSYVRGKDNLAHVVVTHLQSKYGYGDYSDGEITLSTASINQSTFMTMTKHLTQAWNNSGLSNDYKQVKAAQGENWKAFVYNILYLVKYATNDCQTAISQGNVLSNDVYNKSGMSVIDSNGNTVNTGSGGVAFIEGQVGSGSIAVCTTVSAEKDTATYDSANNYKMSDTGYNKAGINYGYNCLYTHGSDIQGIYTHQFLVRDDGETRKLYDGYAGSDGYTSFFCLGMCNPWGNVWTWIFGTAVLYDGSNLWAYIKFSDYSYTQTSTSWYLADNNSGFSTNDAMLTNTRGYIRLAYKLPKSLSFFRYLGTSVVQSDPYEMLVGLPDSRSSTGSSTTGLCDTYYFSESTTKVFAIAHGGCVNSSSGKGGMFYFAVDNVASHTNARFGFRAGLVNNQ